MFRCSKQHQTGNVQVFEATSDKKFRCSKQHQTGKIQVFEATSDEKYSGVRSNIRREIRGCSKQHQTRSQGEWLTSHSEVKGPHPPFTCSTAPFVPLFCFVHTLHIQEGYKLKTHAHAHTHGTSFHFQRCRKDQIGGLQK